jgi:predicted RNase H-like nuclease
MDALRETTCCRCAQLWGELEDVEMIGIDIPIGFGPRQADSAAKQFLTGAASTVFTIPALEAFKVSFARGQGISRRRTPSVRESSK